MEEKFTSQLKDLKLYKENNQYYLNATYVNEECEISVPKIKLPFSTLNNDELVIGRTTCEDVYHNSNFYINNAYDNAYIKSRSHAFPIEKVHKTKHIDESECPSEGVYFTAKKIVQDMTLEEIEKKLGHKVRIVNKEK